MRSSGKGTPRRNPPAAFAQGSLPRLSQVVGRLEKRGWVRRNPDPTDGRYTVAALTDDGLRQGGRHRSRRRGGRTQLRRRRTHQGTGPPADHYRPPSRRALERVGIPDAAQRAQVPSAHTPADGGTDRRWGFGSGQTCLRRLERWPPRPCEPSSGPRSRKAVTGAPGSATAEGADRR
ncbi:MarR family winged helix-turn-helix transcriptional regulator [Streptomyces chattanoogensis]|uniref:MarR family winged helix-turn-helix transcriptional regulator n=1 Tax=Streptomyces chattanoogensis TaxID=66876 RepID=UPI00316AE1C9